MPTKPLTVGIAVRCESERWRFAAPFLSPALFSSKCATTTAAKKKVSQNIQFRQLTFLHIRCLYIFYSVVRLLGFVLWVLLLIRSFEPTQPRFIRYWFLLDLLHDRGLKFYCRQIVFVWFFELTRHWLNYWEPRLPSFCRSDILPKSIALTESKCDMQCQRVVASNSTPQNLAAWVSIRRYCLPL